MMLKQFIVTYSQRWGFILVLTCVMMVLATTFSPVHASMTQQAVPTATPSPSPIPTSTSVSIGGATLRLSKTASPINATVGTLVTFVLLVTNDGTSNLNNVVVTDSVPSSFTVNTVISSKGQVSATGNVVRAVIDEIAPGEIVEITITATVNTNVSSLITNTAIASSNEVLGLPASAQVKVVAIALPQSGVPDNALLLYLALAIFIFALGAAVRLGALRQR